MCKVKSDRLKDTLSETVKNCKENVLLKERNDVFSLSFCSLKLAKKNKDKIVNEKHSGI